jgi:hypothetical protein
VAGWTLLVYRVPTEPASRRVTVWRQLKRMGALYIQQCVCLLPARADLEAELNRRAAAIRELGGDYTLFDIPTLRPGDEERVTGLFRDLRNKEYDEIIEECETKFFKEIEFERFRENYTYAETEEIRQDLDKIRRWFKRVAERDWFEADRRSLAEQWIARCDDLLNAFEQEVYQRQSLDISDEIDLSPLRAMSVGRINDDCIDEELES